MLYLACHVGVRPFNEATLVLLINDNHYVWRSPYIASRGHVGYVIEGDDETGAEGAAGAAAACGRHQQMHVVACFATTEVQYTERLVVTASVPSKLSSLTGPGLRTGIVGRRRVQK